MQECMQERQGHAHTLTPPGTYHAPPHRHSCFYRFLTIPRKGSTHRFIGSKTWENSKPTRPKCPGESFVVFFFFSFAGHFLSISVCFDALEYVRTLRQSACVRERTIFRSHRLHFSTSIVLFSFFISLVFFFSLVRR